MHSFKVGDAVICSVPSSREFHGCRGTICSIDWHRGSDQPNNYNILSVVPYPGQRRADRFTIYASGCQLIDPALAGVYEYLGRELYS